MRRQKITFGEMRLGRAGTRGILDIEPRFVCKACEKRGADVRPHFAPASMGTTN